MQDNTSRVSANQPPPIKPILVLPTDASQIFIDQARKSGYFVILTDQPDGVRVVMPQICVGAGKIAQAALGALASDANPSPLAMRFVKNLNTLLFAPEVAVPAKTEEGK